MKLTTIILVFHVLALGSSLKQETNPDDEYRERSQMSDMFKGIMRNYDKSVRPKGQKVHNKSGSSSPTKVTVKIYLRSVREIDDERGTISVALSLIESWNDHRLSYNSQYSYPYILIGEADNIWKPDTFFRNEISRTDSVPQTSYAKVFPDGKVRISRKLDITFSCPMNFKRYPFDSQSCYLALASWSSNSDEVVYEWKTYDAISLKADLWVDKFMLDKYETRTCDAVTDSGRYSCLKAILTLTRNSGPITYIFTPHLLLLTATFVCLWSPYKRSSMQTLCFLSLLFHCAFIQRKTPKIGYWTRLDLWMLCCLTLVLICLFETTVVEKCLEKKGGKLPSKTTANRRLILRLDLIFRALIFPILIAVFICLSYFLWQ